MDAGSFDFTTWSRDALKLNIEEMYEVAAKDQKEADSGVLTLFSLIGDYSEKRFTIPPEVPKHTPKSEVLKKEKELLGFFLTGHPMDAYRSILQRLSCTSLCALENLEHSSVVRAAFIVETVQIRISQKNQKKFAILNISDGMETYELPIWAEMFEQKADLLEENQLLYAVLQVDKREETMRLSCRWLENLTKVNEEMIEACDKAFDRAKVQATRFTSPPKQTKQVIVNTKYEIKLNIRLTRLSHILKIKELLYSHPGPTNVHLHFYAEEQRVGMLQLATSITPSPTFETSLKALPCLQSVVQS